MEGDPRPAGNRIDNRYEPEIGVSALFHTNLFVYDRLHLFG
ncbi:hypothetical protein [Paenibacillus oenotherae]|nr:hypothetical protein [Paenibacillus oenotherae]